MNRVPRWRIAAAAVVLAGLAFFTAVFAPIYIRNMRLQRFVADLPQRVEEPNSSGPPSDDAVRTLVVDKARDLGLPVMANNVQITRSRQTAKVERVAVRYIVRVDLPGYTVDLHFYPGAGSR